MTTFEIGSITAKGGFANEKGICKKFNDWEKDNEAQTWLKIMGYDIESIDSVEAILIPTYNKTDDTTTWILKDINTVMNFFGSGEIRMSPKGSLHIGRITMQRKGGTPDPTKLQFKIKPCELFKL